MEPRILVTPHIAGATDIMLDGTVSYLGNVLTDFRQGIHPEGIVNEPANPRVPLRICNEVTMLKHSLASPESKN
jgi:phosphoglycerate dehydrogenase-like enzyme